VNRPTSSLPPAASAPGRRALPRRHPAQPRSLAFALSHAAAAVQDVRSGRALTESLAQRLPALPAEARPAVQAIAFDALRGLGLAQALKRGLAPRPVPDAQVDALLLVALHALAEPQPVHAPHTLVDQAVQAVAALPQGQRYKSLVNGVLRTFLREREARLAEALRDPAARYNYPAWWIARVRRHYPDAWEAILAAGNERPPMTLRVNRRRFTAADYRAQLEAAGIAVAAAAGDALVLAEAVAVDALPGFRDGACSVQDVGAQQATAFLDVRDGMRVLDACAAPGGKTTHLLETADLELLALDSDARRLPRVQENLDRLGLSATLLAADAARTADWWDGRPFDRILLDAPCTASGIVRRHPDIRWLRRESDIAQLAEQQSALLAALWPLLAPGGKLLYVTCSIFPEEGLEQAHRFATAAAHAHPLPTPGQLLPQSTSVPHDGFFHALFEKR
jgi:16S rRNA (cytosine967-C5)-methyltransferase